MAMELRWLASTSTSCLHAAAAILRGRQLADPELSQALRPATDLLRHEIELAGQIPAHLLSQLIPLSASIDNNSQLAETAFHKSVGPAQADATSVTRVGGAISELENTFTRRLPDAIAALETRGRVLREQWESRGPGMLASVSRLTEDELITGRAEVVLLHPATGGGGEAFLPNNVVTIEAMLANPHVDLPEVVRLGWMLSTLDLDLPMLSETISSHRVSLVGSLAMLPVALAAAEEVEWCQNHPGMIERAITAWQVDVADSAAAAQLVAQWWAGYQSAKPRWPVALAALNLSLREANVVPGDL